MGNHVRSGTTSDENSSNTQELHQCPPALMGRHLLVKSGDCKLDLYFGILCVVPQSGRR